MRDGDDRRRRRRRPDRRRRWPTSPTASPRPAPRSSDVVKTLCFLTDMGTFAEFNEAYADGFGDHRPARSTVEVSALPGGMAVEVEAWAYKPA